jgi:4-hydroxy 2-oxovalerate aldolase
MDHYKDPQAKGTWVTFRPDITVLDCTVRDGGLVNDCRHTDEFVKAVYDTCVASGIDYMEIGYKADSKVVSRDEFGAWKFCDEDDVRRIVGDNPTNLKLSVMADVGRTDYHTDIIPRERSVLDMIRIACYIHQIPAAQDMIQDAHDKGYETTLNLMAVSTVQERELEEALTAVARGPVDAIYLVDSYGSLYSEQIKDLALLYLRAVQGTGKQVGIHAHNNLQLAFANTIESLIVGVSRLDATIAGFGRGAGNCPLELLVGFLKNPKLQLRPVIECVEKVMLPLAKQLDWGYSIPYMMSGLLNQHPRDAMAMRDGPNRDAYLDFYDRMYDN